MAVRKINESTLTDIANAIRSKTGGSALINPEDMASEIDSISAGQSTAPYKVVVGSLYLENGGAITIQAPNIDPSGVVMVHCMARNYVDVANELFAQGKKVNFGFRALIYNGYIENGGSQNVATKGMKYGVDNTPLNYWSGSPLYEPALNQGLIQTTVSSGNGGAYAGGYTYDYILVYKERSV